MIKNSIKAMAVVAFVSILSACSNQTQIYSNTQMDANTYQTFSWPAEGPVFVRSDYNLPQSIGNEVQTNIKAKMEAKGYKFVEQASSADLVVLFSVGAQNKVKAEKAPSYFSENGRWGSEYLEVVGDKEVVTYVEGALAIDIFDRQNQKQVWFGAAKKKLSEDATQEGLNKITDSVSEILDSLPNAEQS